MAKPPSEPEKPFHKYARYSGAGFEIMAYILIFVGIGYGLDQWLKPAKPWFTLVFSLLGCAAAIFKAIQRFGNIS